MDMGTVKEIEIGAVRGTGHVEKLAVDDGVVVSTWRHCCEIRTFASERLRVGGMKTVSHCRALIHSGATEGTHHTVCSSPELLWIVGKTATSRAGY